MSSVLCPHCDAYTGATGEYFTCDNCGSPTKREEAHRAERNVCLRTGLKFLFLTALVGLPLPIVDGFLWSLLLYIASLPMLFGITMMLGAVINEFRMIRSQVTT